MSLPEHANPYVGPAAFRRHQADSFFGRDRDARKLLSLINTKEVVLFYAPSGAGKTSLINAKIVPALENDGYEVLPIARVGHRIPQTAAPTNVFIFNILTTLDRNVDTARLETRSLVDFLRADALADDLEDRPLETHRILIIDQFEEILTTHAGHHDQRDDFFLQLRQALADRLLYSVVLVLREDHLAGLDRFSPLLPDRMRTRFRMERLRRDNATTAIRRPAERAGRPFAPGVAEALADNLCRVRAAGWDESVAGEFVEPVQLQVVCFHLWQSLDDRPSSEITQADLEGCGQVDLALERFYEDCIERVAERTGVDQAPIRRWFSESLITPSRIRNQVHRDVEHAAGIPERAVALLVDQHLIRSETRRGGSWLELVHDRFIEPIISANETWLAEHQSPLTIDARTWDQAGRDASFLAQGQKLADAIEWSRANTASVGELERGFLEESNRAQARQSADRQRTARRLQLLSAALTLALATVVLLGLIALSQAREANRAVQISLAKTQTFAAYSSLSTDPQKSLAVVLPAAESAHRIGPTAVPEAGDVLRQALQASRARVIRSLHTGDFERSALDHDGRRLATLHGDGSLSIWDVAAERRVFFLDGEDHPTTAFALGRTGDLLATAGGGFIQWWTVESGDKSWRVAAATELIEELILDPSGQRLAAIDRSGAVRIWTFGSENEVSAAQCQATLSAAFGPRGQHLVCADDSGGVQVGDPASGRTLLAFGAPSKPTVRDLVVFNHDGTRLAAASSSAVEIWDLQAPSASPRRLYELGHIQDLAFDPSGRYLVCLPWDGPIQLFDLVSGRASPVRLGPADAGEGPIRLSHDGQRFATADHSGQVTVWQLLLPDTTQTLAGAGQRVNQVAFSPDGKVVAGASGKSVRLWHADSGEPLRKLSGHRHRVNALVFSPDGGHVATASNDGTAKIWVVRSGKLERTLTGHSEPIVSLAIDPTGSRLATASLDGIAKAWSLTSGQELFSVAHDGQSINAVAFMPGSSRSHLATAGSDRTIRLWAPSGSPIGQPVRHTDSISAMAFDPTGQLLATVGDDRFVTLWQVAAGRQRYRLESETGRITAVAFGPTGKNLATGDVGRDVILWDVDSGARQLRIRTPSPLHSVAFSPNGKRLATGARDGAIRLEKHLTLDALIAAARARQS